MAAPLGRTALWSSLLLLPLAVNGWKLLALGYRPGELAGNLGFDLLVVGLLVLVALVNPVRWGLVHRGLWVALVGSWLVASPPQGFWGWFGAAVVAAFLAVVMPRLHTLTGLVVVGLVLAFSIVRAALPEYYRDEAASALSKKLPQAAVQAFVGGLADHGVPALARERARWAVEPGRVGGAQMRRLHRDLRGQMRALGVYFVHWERLGCVPVGGGGDEQVVRCSGLSAGILHDEADRPAGSLPATTISTGLPNVGLRLGPFECTVRRQPDGTFRVVEAPDHVPIEPVVGR
ncbi:MAG: hypothetical protein AB2L07_05635 [Thermoanaerobaculaceae bacterium]